VTIVSTPVVATIAEQVVTYPPPSSSPPPGALNSASALAVDDSAAVIVPSTVVPVVVVLGALGVYWYQTQTTIKAGRFTFAHITKGVAVTSNTAPADAPAAAAIRPGPTIERC